MIVQYRFKIPCQHTVWKMRQCTSIEMTNLNALFLTEISLSAALNILLKLLLQISKDCSPYILLELLLQLNVKGLFVPTMRGY